MRDKALVFDPIVAVREVVESYLASGILLPNWSRTLREASSELSRLGDLWDDPTLTSIGEAVHELATDRLVEDARTRDLARRVGALLDDVVAQTTTKGAAF